MTSKQTINRMSFQLIHEELVLTMNKASMHLEMFINERENVRALEDAIQSLQQIRGSLDLSQLYGACELAGDMVSLAMSIDDLDIKDDRRTDARLSALTKGLFILSCYFEYVQQHEAGMPILLVPYINEIRLTNTQPTMLESDFEQSNTSYRRPRIASPITVTNLSDRVRQLRRMYQLGLLGFMKEVSVTQSLQLMQRSCSKIGKLALGTASETLWWLATHSLNAFIEAKMAPNITRKRLFSHLDMEIKKIMQKGELAFEADDGLDALLGELAFYVALSGIEQSEYDEIKRWFGYEHVKYTEKILQRETASLVGPDANTVRSVADVLRTELNIAKECLEHVQNEEGVLQDEYKETISRIRKVQQILDVVGLTSAAGVLNQPLERLQHADNNAVPMADDDNVAMIDTFFYVESVLHNLEKRSFSSDQLEKLNQLTQNEAISDTHLQGARSVVLREVKNDLTVVKDALTLFLDSSYDREHLKDLPARLHAIRGGMVVLSLPEVAEIMNACTLFVDKVLLSTTTNETAAMDHMLETFADALICLEYYLDCMNADRKVSADTLRAAKESLAALGFKVT